MALSVIAALGCARESEHLEKRRQQWCVGESEREKLVECVVRVTTAGNPKSDEEGEDLVAQAEGTCKRLICPERWVTCKVIRGYGDCWYP
ncbi:MAG TPA: hypothetical protein VGB13_13465 [Candidatus Krumholzibacteria bacterium]